MVVRAKLHSVDAVEHLGEDAAVRSYIKDAQVLVLATSCEEGLAVGQRDRHDKVGMWHAEAPNFKTGDAVEDVRLVPVRSQDDPVIVRRPVDASVVIW